MIANANALQIPIADKSVHSIITSPPYFNLRDYQIAGQIGLEASPAEYVEALRQVGREAWRVLRDDGSFWLNLGDSFAGNNSSNGEGENRKPSSALTGGQSTLYTQRRVTSSGGLRPKSLIGIPWRVAFALQDDGWILRSEIIWEKPNAMPESVTDRPTKAHEHIFLLTKQPRYFYDAEAVKEAVSDNTVFTYATPDKAAKAGQQRNGKDNSTLRCETETRNRRTVWSVATTPYSGAHFACWPPSLVEPMVKASTSERGVCPACGAPWVRIIEKVGQSKPVEERNGRVGHNGQPPQTSGWFWEGPTTKDSGHWRPTCQHEAEPIPAIVLDPFTGSGTTGQVCRQLGRRFIGLDLNPEYLGLLAAPRAERKTIQAALDSLPLFAGLG